MNLNELLPNLIIKNKKVIARTISLIEKDNAESIEIIKSIFNKTGNAYRVGITGPPGVGKSTITNQLTKFYRGNNKTVAIIAIDPTSPFSGGALLGDRIRMADIGKDEGVFIRSMATRGNLGGLSKKTVDAADVLDAAGFDYIFFETVGVGQSELDIAKAVDTTIVALCPDAGDSIQAMKAGLMEIADLFVMNKSDRPGVDPAIMAIQTVLNFHLTNERSWLPKIIKSVATQNIGIGEIAEGIENHKKYLEDNNLFQRKREHNSKLRIKEIVELKIKNELWSEKRESSLDDSIEKVVLGHISPYLLAEELINHYKNELI